MSATNAPGDGGEPGEEILRALLRLFTHWGADRTQNDVARAAGVDLDAADQPALFTLGMTGPLRVGELARELRATNSATSKTVARLAAAGLVETRPIEHDRRGVDVRLTAAGADAFDRLLEVSARTVRAALPADPDDCRRFETWLLALTDALRAHPRTDQPPASPH